MAVSANGNLGGCVIQLRLYLIDMVQKNYKGVPGLWALSLLPSLSTIVDSHIKTIGLGFLIFNLSRIL